MRRILTASALLLMALGGPIAGAWAQTTQPDQIEEDWQIVIGTPDATGAGPQMSTAMSPVSDGSTPFFVFDLNYRDSPTFQPGGLQAQVWSGDQMLSSSTNGSQVCNTTGETITWTQRMKISSGNVSFAVDSGKSTTWGKFGQGQQLNIGGSFATSLADLSGYSPATSVANSGAGWERNRVTSMTLLRVRYYAGGKLLSTDNTSRSVDLTK